MLLLIIFILFIVPLVLYILSTRYYHNRPDVPSFYFSYSKEDYTEATRKREEYEKHFLYKIVDYDIDFGLGTLSCVFGVIYAIAIIILIVNHINPAAQGKRLQETQKALEYKISSDYERDTFGFYNKELVDDVQTWNEGIVGREESEHNIWIGVFYPDIIDKYDLHTIELK